MSEKSSNSFFRICNSPEIGTRFRYMGYQLAGFVYFLVRVFVRAGLIAKNHPCAQPANVGKYSFGEIIGMAYSNIEWNRKGIAQIMVFLAVILSAVLMALSLAIIVIQIAFQTGTAYAQTPPVVNPDTHMFSNPADGAGRSTDWVYQLLSNIFGNTGLGYFAGSNVQNVTWIHNALTSMLSLYSIAMMVIAAIIIAYYITTAVLETSAEGIPFGDRFNLVWAPIRFVLALALLAPVSNGYNVAQLMVFQAADWGSGFASYIWANGLLAFGDQQVIGKPEPDQGASFTRGLWLSSICVTSWNQYVHQQSDTLATDLMRVTTSTDTQRDTAGEKTRAVIYRFGNRLAPDYCGALRIPIVEQQVVLSGGLLKNQGGRIIEAKYQDIFSKLSGGMSIIGSFASTYGWGNPADIASLNGDIGNGTGALNAVINPNVAGVLPLTRQFSRVVPVGGTDLVSAINGGTLPTNISIPAASYVFTEFFNPESPLYNSYEDVYDHPYFDRHPNLQTHWLNDIYNDNLDDALIAAKAAQEETAKQMVEHGAKQGWGQAGSYFMIIAQMNGSIQNAFNNKPSVVKLPELLTDKNSLPEAKGVFARALQWFVEKVTGVWGLIFGKSQVDNKGASDFTYEILKQGELWWDNTAKVSNETEDVNAYGTLTMESLTREEGEKSSFGFGLMSMFKKLMAGLNKQLINLITSILGLTNTYNPFAILSILGVALMGLGMIGMVAGIGLTFGGVIQGAGYFFMAIAGTIIGAGVSLYIILPLIPYFYFMMAVINWAIGIFEAVVAMPLWALSFLKIDGEGLFPEESKGALVIMFQIFLRPPMIIVSLVGSMLVFSGTIIFLNLTFGEMMRGMLDSAGIGSPIMAIFLLIGYVYIVYSLAMAVFKMVDTIPNMIMDYMGIGGLTPMTDYDDPARTSKAAFFAAAGFVARDIKSGLSDARSSKEEKEELERIYERGKRERDAEIFERLKRNTGSEAEAARLMYTLNQKNTSSDSNKGTEGDDT